MSKSLSLTLMLFWHKFDNFFFHLQPPVLLNKSKSMSSVDWLKKPGTSIDLELDLQASQAKLSQLSDEINRLKQLKQKFEEAKSKGTFTTGWIGIYWAIFWP